MTQWASALMAKRERSAIPILTHPGIEMCGRNVQEAVTDGRVHYQAIRKLCDAYPSAAATTIMDLTVEAEAFGAEVAFAPGEVPSVTGVLVKDMDDAERLEVPDVSRGRIPQYLMADCLAAENILDRPTLAGCIGPYSLAGRLMGMTEIMTGIYTDPELVELLLEKCTEFLLRYCQAIKATGVGGVVMAEPAAGLLSPEDCSAYSSLYVKRIVGQVQDDSFWVVLHNCGNTGHCTPAMVETGAKGLHFGNRANMTEALEACPADCLVMGNLDPVGCLKTATAGEVYRAASQLLEQTSACANFVLSTGCDVPPQVPEENIAAFYRALRDYNASRSAGAIRQGSFTSPPSP